MVRYNKVSLGGRKKDEKENCINIGLLDGHNNFYHRLWKRGS